MDPLKRAAEGAATSRRRRPTTHPWADAYLRAHGIENAALRAELLRTIVARAESRAQDQALDDANAHVMAEAQEFLDERLAGFVGGFAPGQEAIAGRLAFQLADGPAQCPEALLDPTTAPAAVRFAMRTAQLPRTPTLLRASMVSRPLGRSSPANECDAPPRAQASQQRWLRFVLCVLSLALVTCHS
jgi:hypothetical protein